LSRLDAFRQGLRDLGHVEGEDVIIEHRSSEGRDDRLASLAAELVRLKVDVIVTGGSTPATVAVKNATSTIPIVFAAAADPVATRLVMNLARPGGNVTGLSLASPDVSAKRLQLATELIPGLSHVAVLSNPANPASVPQMQELRAAAHALQLRLHVVEVGSLHDLEPGVAGLRKDRTAALIVLQDPLFMSHRRQVVESAERAGLPTISAWREFAEAGSLMAYGPSIPDLFRRAAAYVHRILRGAKPADLPVEQPIKFELVINLKTAKALGLKIPPLLLARADQIIE
jgi:putative ABC transport system substrate-binding protein